jgi:Coenzyme PQQ synthesis protein D (PqqD)
MYGSKEMESIESREILIPAGIRETTSQDGAVLLDIEQGICFSLNPVGLKIWELLKQGQSVDKVADTLATEFPVSRQQVLADTEEFISELEAKHLIRRSEQKQSRKSWFERLMPFARRQDRAQPK